VPTDTSNDEPSRAGRRDYAAGRSTRAELIATAERLFAERGLDAVSMREISAASGTRNTGAGQYYFGNKDALVRVVFEFRAETLNARRSELLAELGTWSDGVRGTLDAIVRPLAEQIGKTHYVSFLARLQADRARDERIVRPGSDVDASFRQCRSELRRRLPGVPDEVFRRRFRLVVRIVVAALADHERSTATTPNGVSALEQLITDLLDASVALLRAPTAPAGKHT
jgi:AcrR family transcriptional regulator